MGFFSLPFGVKVSGSDPLDAERYIKDTLEDRNALFDAARTYVGLQCFVGDTLYIFKGPARDDWDVIGTGGPDDPAPEDTFIYGQADGAWKKVTGLQALDAGSGNISLGVIGEDPAKHRAPAEGAVDMSIVPDWDTTLRGTNSPYSFMAGEGNDITSTAWDHTIFGGANLIETGADEHACTAIGAWNVISKGYGSTALGAYNHVNGGINGFGLLAGMNNSSGNNAHGASAIGIALSVDANSMTAVGASNVIWTGDRDAANRPIFSVGIGTYTTPDTAWAALVRKDGFNVLADGSVIAPSLTNALIDAVGDKSLITKEYLENNSGAPSGSNNSIQINDGGDFGGAGEYTTTYVDFGVPVLLETMALHSSLDKEGAFAVDTTGGSSRPVYRKDPDGCGIFEWYYMDGNGVNPPFNGYQGNGYQIPAYKDESYYITLLNHEASAGIDFDLSFDPNITDGVEGHIFIRQNSDELNVGLATRSINFEDSNLVFLGTHTDISQDISAWSDIFYKKANGVIFISISHMDEQPASGGGISKFASNIGDNAATSIAVTHSLGSRDVSVSIYRATAPYDEVDCDVFKTDINTVTLEFTTAPTLDEYRVTIIG